MTNTKQETTLTETELTSGKVEDSLPKWSGRGRPPNAIMKDIREKKVAFYKTKKKKKEIIAAISKFDLFLEEFVRNGGNATDAAWQVYKCKNRAVAAEIGRQQLQKARDVGRIYLEAEGFSYGKLLKVAATKMVESDKPDWWDRLMKISGYEDFVSKNKPVAAGQTNIINVIGQTEKDLVSEYIEGEYADGNKED